MGHINPSTLRGTRKQPWNSPHLHYCTQNPPTNHQRLDIRCVWNHTRPNLSIIILTPRPKKKKNKTSWWFFFTHPFEKYACRQNGKKSSPQGSGYTGHGSIQIPCMNQLNQPLEKPTQLVVLVMVLPMVTSWLPLGWVFFTQKNYDVCHKMGNSYGFFVVFLPFLICGDKLKTMA